MLLVLFGKRSRAYVDRFQKNSHSLTGLVSLQFFHKTAHLSDVFFGALTGVLLLGLTGTFFRAGNGIFSLPSLQSTKEKHHFSLE